jgi:small subunit ribosomal protein S15
MYLNTEAKQEIFKKHGKSEKDSGTAEGQVALFTERINHLTEHLKKNQHDFATERSLIIMVGKRKKLLKYLEAKDIERYRAIIKLLKLRK